MSNTRRSRWHAAEVTAADAVDELEAAITEAQAEAARLIMTEHLTSKMTANGISPDLIAEAMRQLHELGDDYWADIYRMAPEE